MGVLVGKSAPDFEADAVVNGTIREQVSLKDLSSGYTLLFFYPLDFTFVCPTELHAFQEAQEAFKQRDCAIVGCSVDSAHSHLAWLNTPKEKGGIEGVTYPILADLTKEIARKYDVLLEEKGIAYRGLFLIDKTGTVRHQIVNDLPLGRSVEEALRVLDALIFTETHGEVCPANWSSGKQGMRATQEGLTEYMETEISSV